MKIYIVMVDTSGNMRSSCDVPKAAFDTKEEAQEFINKNTKTFTHEHPLFGLSTSTLVCGGFFAEIKEVDYIKNSGSFNE